MSIDVLSHADTAPIIVGDAEDMSDLQGVGSEAGTFHLVMNGPNGAHHVPLSPEASQNFGTAQHLLLVSLQGNEIATARRVSMGNLGNGQELSSSQCHDLAQGLSLAEQPRDFRTAALAEFRRNHPDLAAA